MLLLAPASINSFADELEAVPVDSSSDGVPDDAAPDVPDLPDPEVDVADPDPGSDAPDQIVDDAVSADPVNEDMENESTVETDTEDTDITPEFLEYLDNLSAERNLSLSDAPEDVEIAEDVPLDDIDLYSADGEPDYKNVVVYHGRFNNTDCDIVFPINALEGLDIINGYLVNVSSSTITGRLLYSGDSLDPAVYNCYDYVLAPLYGSTSNVYSYGSRNYQRHYYLNTNQGYNRITYSDMYGNFYTDSYDRYYSEKYRMYYAAIAAFILGGALLICRKH